MLEKAFKIKWQDKIPDTEVPKKAGIQSMHTVLKLHVAQLIWTGHLKRIPDERLLWRTTRGKALSIWPEETLQRHPQSFSEGFLYINGEQTGIKVAREQLYEKREFVKLKESTENAKPRPMGHQQIP